MKPISRTEILAMIPHGESICLLDEVQDWDADWLRCRSQRFLAADNPLRRADGSLGAACGIEIAAQAMAVHGRLTAPQQSAPVPGFLVSVRDVHLAHPWLATGPLLIEARRLMGDGRGASYSFTLTAMGTDLLRGRATVMFGAPL
jgi:predicted hotdog family 3-hydroxylacyl-ACP dehydratase